MTAASPSKISLGVSPTVVLILGDRLIGMANETMPNVTLSVIEERLPGLVDALDQKQADIAFVFDIDARKNFSRIALLQEDLLLVRSASEHRPNRDDVTFAEALKSNLVMAGSRGQISKIVASAAERHSLAFKINSEVHSIGAMKAMVLAGKASTIMPYSLASEEINDGALHAQKIVQPSLTRILYLVRRQPHSSLPFESELQSFINNVTKTYLRLTQPWSRPL